MNFFLSQELKDENGRLYKLLAERDEEMRILRKQVNQERQAIAGKILRPTQKIPE